MLELNWQHVCMIAAHDSYKFLDDSSLSANDFRPKNISPPKGWKAHHQKWGKWHIIGFDRTTQTTITIMWRRMIKQKDRVNSERYTRSKR